MYILDMVNSRDHKYNDISKEELYKNRVRKSIFFVFAFIGAFTINIFSVVQFYEKQLSISTLYGTMTLYMIICILLGMFYLPYHPKYYGFNFKYLGSELIVGIIIGIFTLLISILIRLYLINEGCSYLSFHFSLSIDDVLRILAYPMAAIVQETAVKGYFQSYLVAILDGSKVKKSLSIIVSSLIFAQFHLILGMWVFALTFIFSCLTGIIYERRRSVIAVSIIHFMAGAGLLMFRPL